ncbi:hypothetical protein LOK74_03945 [Brevibacillus humidisoli]|uniref:hypothetical protein n=1 Tax=Brevibacillus humidisoli TaxID=2895522 RepID=UPI001E5459A7|nr:hypothetical protein [Brevibacillus humidisoli]UFJ41676.1 hypothetical protein LOK74_03945 [Brevibacillus humidisoli]
MKDRQLMPTISPDPSLRSPTQETMGQILSSAGYTDLYRLVEAEGLPYFPRIDAAGDVELYLVFESVEEFSKATRDELSIDWKTYRDKLFAVVWTLTDPIEPLGFPIAFDIGEERERYMALRLVQQPLTWIHHLAFQEGQLIHIYSETVSFSPAERDQVYRMAERLFADNDKEQSHCSAAGDEEIREEELTTVDADSLGDSTLLESGVAYQFDYAAMEQRHGEEHAQVLLMEALNRALLVMRRHARSDVRSQSFIVWVAKAPPYLSMIVTPGMDHLFEVVHSAEEEANPFTRFFLTLPDFVETRELQPLAVGAYPIIRSEQGRPLHLELTETFQRRLKTLFDTYWPATPNPYE